MRYLALACDYDGTLAADGRVTEHTLAALERVLASGRKLILVTGRELEDLLTVFPQVHLFERIVAENGALLYRPAAQEDRSLGERPPEEFIQRLHARGIAPLSVGHVIVSTRQPHETIVLEVIREMGLELQVIFNKGAVMVLPAGINKASGLAAALRELGLSSHNTVGIGDAENDHAFLSACECAVAVANALPMLQQRADLVTEKANGEGAIELIDRLLANDLSDLEHVLTLHHVLLGTREGGAEIRVNPYGSNLLIAGTSGSGKSTVATSLLERLGEVGYQFCIVDPEGDYESFEGAVVLGDRQRIPGVEEILQLLANPDSNSVINLLGVPLQDRPAFFAGLLPRLQELRARTGRPHWTVVDEAHHLLPSSWDPASLTVSQKIENMVFITVHPDQVSPAILSAIDILVVVGDSPETTIKNFTASLGQRSPNVSVPSLQTGEVLVWLRREQSDPFLVHIAPGRVDHRRHRRKYAEGELGPYKSFYFQGPEKKLNLRAHNLLTFLQLADGVDDAIWSYHLKRRDYSRWFRETIRDERLAEETIRIEERTDLAPAETRALIKATIEEYYTLPSSSSTPPHRTGPEQRRDPLAEPRW